MKNKKEILIFKGDVLPKEDTRSVSYFCHNAEIYTAGFGQGVPSLERRQRRGMRSAGDCIS